MFKKIEYTIKSSKEIIEEEFKKYQDIEAIYLNRYFKLQDK